MARDLVSRGLPVHALALIDKAVQASAANTPGLCPEEKRLATDRIDDSFRKARDANVLLKEGRWADARAAADAAIVANSDNAVARTASQAAKDGAAQEQQSALQKLQARWKTFTDDELAPSAALLVPFLATVMVLLVASRLLVLVDVKWPALEGRPAARRRRLVLFAGVLQLVFSATMLTFGVAGFFATRGLALLLGVVAGLLGVFLTAWWLATRLRLEVKVTHEDDKEKRAEAALVTTFLYELGVKKPEGLEVPRGVDVTALSGALTTLPDNAISKAFRSFLTALAGTTPWVASIEGEKGGRTVSISRNGRAVASTVIDVHSLQPVTPDVAANDKVNDRLAEAPLRMVAAFILVTLAKEHPSIKSGLAGATDWRSVGLQYVATTLLRGDADAARKKRMLGRALERDLDNLAAQLAFRHATDRESSDAKVLIEYRDWLQDCENRLTELGLDESAMRLRTCYLRTVIATNAVFAEGHTAVEKTSERIAAADNALADLDDLVDRLNHSDELRSIITSMKANSRGLRQLLALLPETRSRKDAPAIRSTKGPMGTYNDACYFASKHSWLLLHDDSAEGPRPGDTMEDDKVAVALLKSARADPAIESWMPVDPQLREFRRRHAYREAFLQAPATDIFACGPLKPYAGRLRAAGYGNASVLAGLQGNPNPLADVIPADVLIRQSIIELACLQASFTAGLKKRKWATEMLNQLASRGLASVSTLSKLDSTDRDNVAQTIAEELVSRFKTGESLSNLHYEGVVKVLAARIRRWLRSLTTAP